jgi:hypothetical protein
LGANDDHFYLIENLILGKWTPLVARRTGALTKKGEVNRLAVRAEGTHYTLFVNGQYQDEVDDKELTGGVAGLWIEVDKANDTVSLEFGNFEVRAP